MLLFLFLGCLVGMSQTIAWEKLDEGLHFTEVDSPQKSAIGDSKITILKVDPTHYSFSLVSSKETGEENKTARGWAEARKLIAAVNTGMYQTDHQTSVGYMKNYDFVNNGRVNKDNTVIAFNRKDESVPEFQIIDRQCQNWDVLKTKYHSYTQGIRMIDCQQKNRWSQQPKKWSMVVMGADKDGNALMIFSRSPYSVHDFINIIKQLPLNISNAMYLEGGPEASFFLDSNGKTVEKYGSYETGFWENDNNHAAWPIPNVIGIQKK